MIRARLAVLCALLLPACASVPPPESMPVYYVFKKICVDAGENPKAVAAAVEAAGGTRMPPYPNQAVDRIVWSFPTPGLAVTTGIDHRTPGNAENDDYSCTIDYGGYDDAGIAAIRKWVGLKPEYINEGPGELRDYHYRIMDKGKGASSRSDASAYFRPWQKGMSWYLWLDRSYQKQYVQFTHYAPEKKVAAL